MRIKREFAAKVVLDPVAAVVQDVYGHGALEACAEAVGVSHQTLSKQLNEVDGNALSLRRAAAIDQFMGNDALADCFAARSGGLFIKLPPLDQAVVPQELVKGYADLLTQFSEFSQVFSQAVADGKVTHAELDRFQKELRDVYTAGERLVQTARVRLVEKARA